MKKTAPMIKYCLRKHINKKLSNNLKIEIRYTI